MILSDTDIKKALASGRVKITPKPDLSKQLGSCSVDLRLGDTFGVFNHVKYGLVEPTKNHVLNDLIKEVKVKKNEPFILQPGDFVLAATVENVELADDLVGFLTGRSSLGRLGLVVHSTASIFDPGWRGKCVLELGNLGRLPISLCPGMKICSFLFEELSSKAETPYDKKAGAKYLDQKKPVLH